MSKHDMERGFDLIWNWLPQHHNRHSSVWWFFLLFPKQTEGFGPKQMMFTLLTRVGPDVYINHKHHTGLDPRSVKGTVQEMFDSMMVGWIYDGQTMHEDIIQQASPATLSRDGHLFSWQQRPSGEKTGCEVKPAGDRPYELAVDFVGQRGEAHFHVWGDPESPITVPWDAFDFHTPLGGSQVVAWRHLNFAGEFTSPGGSEQLAGVGYFQRVCLNVPAFPWKWMWAVFEDETVFSCFIPYVGPHLLRRGDRFFPPLVEIMTRSIRAGSYISLANPGDGNGRNHIEFDKTEVMPLLNGPTIKEYPHFLVKCHSDNGDFIQFTAVPHAHTQYLLDRPVWFNLWRTRFNYNEYLYRIHDLRGRVGGKTLSQQTMGNGFGNCEYTWGLGL